MKLKYPFILMFIVDYLSKKAVFEKSFESTNDIQKFLAVINLNH